MAKPRSNNEFTTISIRWVDKDKLRSLARLVKKTRNGELYESDAVVFNRIISDVNEVNTNPHQTYPTKNISNSSSASQGESQQDSSHEESKQS